MAACAGSSEGRLRGSGPRDSSGRYTAGPIGQGGHRLPLQRVLLAARPQPRLQRFVRLLTGSRQGDACNRSPSTTSPRPCAGHLVFSGTSSWQVTSRQGMLASQQSLQ